VYLKGVAHEDANLLLDLIYKCKISIKEKHLDAFYKLIQELKINTSTAGLTCVEEPEKSGDHKNVLVKDFPAVKHFRESILKHKQVNSPLTLKPIPIGKPKDKQPNAALNGIETKLSLSADQVNEKFTKQIKDLEKQRMNVTSSLTPANISKAQDNENTFKCDVCNFSYQDKIQLQQHVLQLHSNNVKNPKTEDDDKTFDETSSNKKRPASAIQEHNDRENSNLAINRVWSFKSQHNVHTDSNFLDHCVLERSCS
jgi:hypothetical protein